MVLKKKKILLFALNLSVIILTVSCTSWNWQPDPFTGYSDHGSIINGDGLEISCREPAIDGFTCFSDEDMVSLRIEIDKLKISKRQKNQLIRMISQ